MPRTCRRVELVPRSETHLVFFAAFDEFGVAMRSPKAVPSSSVVAMRAPSLLRSQNQRAAGHSRPRSAVS